MKYQVYDIPTSMSQVVKKDGVEQVRKTPTSRKANKNQGFQGCNSSWGKPPEVSEPKKNENFPSKVGKGFKPCGTGNP